MLFNSVEFGLFLPVVFFLYWFVFQARLKTQNLLLVAASYLFYGWWDWRFLMLIAFSSLVDYFVGIGLTTSNHEPRRKLFLVTSICVNLGFLGVFKYFNFFAESFADAFTLLGHPFEATRLSVILPVGISFYTFQTLSYSIDVYRRKLIGTKDIVAFFAFVSFFPQLVAGPIERATNLLPQFYAPRKFSYDEAVIGTRQILWGLVKKVVIADNCATIVNMVFSDYQEYNASTLVVSAVFFSFQIYGDFSGYSDIAIGTARLFGFRLMDNFAFPYFSRDMAEFWRRWHISLSTWFRDYLYIPLGGSRVGLWSKIRNTFVVFLVSGFWHGANWTFILWGALNAIYFLPLLISKRNRSNLDTVAHGKLIPSMRDVFDMGSTFALTLVAWVFFRSDSVPDAFAYLKGMCSSTLFDVPEVLPRRIFGFLVIFVVIEWLGRFDKFAIAKSIDSLPRVVRWLVYYLIVVILIVFGGEQQDFIYFQF